MRIQLPANEIHLWFVDTSQITGQALLSQYRHLLSPQEVIRNQRFKFEKDRKQHLITRALVRSVLSSYINTVSPADWQFNTNEYGKPEVAPETLPYPLKFNVSHSQEMIVLSAHSCQEVGVDIEFLNRKSATKELASHVFSKHENQQLKHLQGDIFNKHFYDFWTLKEAYIKACGMGLSIPLDSFSFSLLGNEEIAVHFEGDREDKPEKWQFWQIRPNDDYIVSLGMKSDAPKPVKLRMRKAIPLKETSDVAYPILSRTLATNGSN
jgi:4'-phosphopantetheinyl transferase